MSPMLPGQITVIQLAAFTYKKFGCFSITSRDQQLYRQKQKYFQPGAVPGDFKYEFNSNGQLDSVFAGSYQPKAFYGINIGLKYKAFDLSIVGYGTYGGKIYNGKKAFRQSLQDNVEASTANNRWTNSNHSETEPRANGGYLPASTYFVESGSYFRLNNINIGYTLPVAEVQKTKVFTSFRVYLAAQNILTITKYTGFTPELQKSNSDYTESYFFGTANNQRYQCGDRIKCFPLSKNFFYRIKYWILV